MPENKFAIGDIVEWDENCQFVAPDKRSSNNTNAPRPLGYCRVVAIGRGPTGGAIQVEIISTGTPLTRTKDYDDLKAGNCNWGTQCFKKVDKFKYTLHEIYSKEST